MSSSLSPWRVVVLMLDPSVFPNSMDFQLARTLGGNFVDVHRPIAALRRNVFVHWVPSNALHIVIMFHNLFNAFPVVRSEDPRDVIGATGEDVIPVRAPREIIDLHCSASVKSS